MVDYIAKKFNVNPSRMQAVGMGEEGLLVATPPETAEPRNRRVEVDQPRRLSRAATAAEA